LREKARNGAKHAPAPVVPDPVNHAADVEAWLVSEERKRIVREVLEELSQKDRSLLRAVFFEEREKAEVCRELGVDRDYLRVLLHRAKSRLRRRMQEPGGSTPLFP
jgi:RNA polymerase sigma factor (sigma-70 family)